MLIQKHHSKRELAPGISADSISMPPSSLSDATVHRHHHGHQHDHLHDQLHGRTVGFKDPVALRNDTAAGMAVKTLSGFGTNTTATIDGSIAASTGDATGAAVSSELSINQFAELDASSLPLADDQDAPTSVESAYIETTVPGSVFTDQSTVAQATPTYSIASSGSFSATNARGQSILQQQLSRADRVSSFRMFVLSLFAGGIWIVFFCLPRQ